MQGQEHGKGKSKPETGLRSLGQGSQIRAQNGEGRAGSRCGVLETETKVCGGSGYAVEDFRSSLGHRDAWIGVPVRCCTECNSLMQMIIAAIPKTTTSVILQHCSLIISVILYFLKIPLSPMPLLTLLTSMTITVHREQNM